MLKPSVFFLIFLFLGFSVSVKAQFLSYEDYVHLPKERQEAFVIKIMELVAEIESNYVHETVTSGYSEERFKKYVQILKEFYHILGVPEALAEDDPNSWSTVMAHMVAAQKQRDLCLYAGWISHTTPSADGNTRCKHPAYTDNFESGYPQKKPNRFMARVGECPVRFSVECNPVIFGYKDPKEKTLFCVSTADNAQNSSYQCMKEALQEPGKQQRLDDLRKNLLSNKNDYEATRSLIYKSCLCSNTPQIDEVVARSVRPRLTCYAMLEMMRQTSYEGCSEPVILSNESEKLFKTLNEHMGKLRKNTDQAYTDAEYSSFVEKEFNKPDMKKEISRICEGEKTSYECKSVICQKSEDGKASPPCSFTVLKITGDKSEPIKFKPHGKLPKSSEKKPFTISGTVKKENLTLKCPAVTVNEKKDQTLKIKKPDESKNAPAPAAPAPAAPAPAAPDPAAPAPAAPAPAAPDPAAPDPAAPDPAAPAPAAPAPAAPDPAAPAPAAVPTPEAEPSEAEPSEAPSEPSEEAKKPELNLIKLDAKETASIKAELKAADGWTLSWSVKDTDQKVEKAWEKKESSSGIESTLPDDGSITLAQAPAPLLEFTQPRYSFNYTVCGKLTKDKETPIEKCVEVPSLEQKPAVLAPLFAPPGMTPPPPMRQSSDTSAMGIK